jgi:hypothetical protein
VVVDIATGLEARADLAGSRWRPLAGESLVTTLDTVGRSLSALDRVLVALGQEAVELLGDGRRVAGLGLGDRLDLDR